MFLIKTIEQYDNNAIHFSESVKNKIINDGTFIRITYSTPMFTLNGLYILIILRNTHSDNEYNKSKYNYNFCTLNNKTHIDNIMSMENDLLRKIEIHNKSPKYNVAEQLKKGFIKKNNDLINYNSNLILKISGIWETETEYGLTYKFLFL